MLSTFVVCALHAKSPRCGFSSDCPRTYSAERLNASAAAWYICNASWVAQFNRRREEAKVACGNHVRFRHQATGGYCLPTLDRTHKPPLVSAGSVRRVRLPYNQSYLLPFDDTFKSANHVEADGRVVNTLLSLAQNIPRDEILVNDFGAGVGQYGRALLSQAPWLKANYRAYDGAGNVEHWTRGFVSWFDLTDEQLVVSRAHWVISIEVGEHIPYKLEGAVLRNLHAHACRGIILSWARLLQAGQGHVNNHDYSYLHDIMRQLGYFLNESLTRQLRTGPSIDGMQSHPYVAKNVAAFERHEPLSSCAPVSCSASAAEPRDMEMAPDKQQEE